MATGDGLLVRFRPAGGALTVDALLAVAAAAERFGNGLLEITSRGNLQVRGLRPATVEAFADAVETTLIVENAPVIETPPLAGLVDDEFSDPRPLAERLRRAIATTGLASRLGPKVSLVVDGGGTANLDYLPADVRIRATAQGWRADCGGTTVKSHLGEAAAMAEAMAALERIAALGPAARGSDATVGGKRERRPPAPALIGRHSLKENGIAFGLGLPFGSVAAGELATLLGSSAVAGIRGLRLASRTLLVIATTEAALDALLIVAQQQGLIIDPDDPRLSIVACPGQGSCAAGTIATRGLAADAAAAAQDLFGDGMLVHVSGCAKGCAHAAPAPMTLSGTEGLCRVIAGGRADGEALATVTPEAALAGCRQLARLYRGERHAQESAATWLGRIEASRIAEAFTSS